MLKYRKFLILLITNPYFILRKIFYKISNIAREHIFVQKELKRLIEHNKNIWSKSKVSNSDSIILHDVFNGSEVILPYTYFLNVLAKKYNSKIFTFSKKSKATFGHLRKSYNTEGHIEVKLDDKHLINKKIEYLKKAKASISNKHDVYNYKINGIWIGIDIYETYLREGAVTVDINDKYFWEIFDAGIENLCFWEEFFENKNVSALVLSHDCYIYYNC